MQLDAAQGLSAIPQTHAGQDIPLPTPSPTCLHSPLLQDHFPGHVSLLGSRQPWSWRCSASCKKHLRAVAKPSQPGRLVPKEPHGQFPSGFVSPGSGGLATPVCVSPPVLAPVRPGAPSCVFGGTGTACHERFGWKRKVWPRGRSSSPGFCSRNQKEVESRPSVEGSSQWHFITAADSLGGCGIAAVFGVPLSWGKVSAAPRWSWGHASQHRNAVAGLSSATVGTAKTSLGQGQGGMFEPPAVSQDGAETGLRRRGLRPGSSWTVRWRKTRQLSPR